MPEPEHPRKLVWLADSLDRLAAFPPTVRQKLGFALYQAQIGQKHESAKMLRGFAEAVWQVRADDPESQLRNENWIWSGSGSRLRAQAGGKVRRRTVSNREFTPSSGNVFADLNLPQEDDLLVKAELAARIIAEIQRQRMTQIQAAAVLGIDQPKVSALKQGKLSGFPRT